VDTDLTIGIATCGRPRILNRCIRSIYKNTNMKFEIIVLDNAGAFTNNKYAKSRINGIMSDRVKVIEIDDKKIGCCESNNIIADECKTKYLMHLDDDVYIPSESRNIIDEMYDLISKIKQPSIIGGIWYDTFYKGMRPVPMVYKFENGKTWKEPQQYKPFSGLIKTDECLHSMIFDKDEIYSRVKWDEHFKWKGDRFDFFLQCKKQNIGLFAYGDMKFIHDPQPFKFGSLSYEDFGGKEAIEYFENKWNLKPIVGWDKKQIKPGNI